MYVNDEKKFAISTLHIKCINLPEIQVNTDRFDTSIHLKQYKPHQPVLAHFVGSCTSPNCL